MKRNRRKVGSVAAVLVTLATMFFAMAAPASAGTAWGGEVRVSEGNNAWSGYICNSGSCDVNLGSYNYIRVRVDCNFPSFDYYSDWMTEDEVEAGWHGKACLGGTKKVQLQVSTHEGFCSWRKLNCKAFVQNYYD